VRGQHLVLLSRRIPEAGVADEALVVLAMQNERAHAR
jgi:hypothetical protein